MTKPVQIARWLGGAALVCLMACRFEPSSVAGDDDDEPDAAAATGDAAPSADGAVSDGGLPRARQKQLTIPSGTVTEALADFPLYVELVDSELAAAATSSGDDIHFVSATGAPLDFEVQRWQRLSGRLEAWVLVSLEPGSDTVLHVRYGDPNGAVPANPAAVWADYLAVFHLEQSPAGGAEAMIDSTGAFHGTAGGGMDGQDSVAGQLGRGVAFDGADDIITFANPLLGSGPHTISAWVDQKATEDNDALIVLGNGMCDQARWLHSRFKQASDEDMPSVAYGFYCDDKPDGETNPVGDSWTALHWTYDESDESRLYRDGSQIGDAFSHSGDQATAGTVGRIGNAPAAFGENMGLNGVVDEVRISDGVRSSAWIAAEYANQSSPSTFYVVGDEQLVE